MEAVDRRPEHGRAAFGEDLREPVREHRLARAVDAVHREEDAPAAVLPAHLVAKLAPQRAHGRDGEGHASSLGRGAAGRRAGRCRRCFAAAIARRSAIPRRIAAATSSESRISSEARDPGPRIQFETAHRRAVEALRHGAHDQVLHRVPAIDDLRVPRPGSRGTPAASAAHRARRRLALGAHVVTAVDLEHQPVADEEVDPAAADPTCGRSAASATQSRHDERLETGVGPRHGLIHRSCGPPAAGEHPLASSRDMALAQRRLPNRKRRLERLAAATSARTFSIGSTRASGCRGTSGFAQCTVALLGVAQPAWGGAATCGRSSSSTQSPRRRA